MKVMTSVTPITRMIGHGKPAEIFRPPGGSVMPLLLRVLRGEAGRPVVGVGERDDADDDRAAEDAEQHLGPHRPQREAEPLALATVVDEQARRSRRSR